MKQFYRHLNSDLIKAGFLVITLTFFAGCDFGDTNINPSTLSDVPVHLILPAAEAQTARNLGSIGSRVTGVIIQHYQGIDAQPLAYNTYLIDENALDDFWRTGLYAGAMKDCQIIIEKGRNQRIPHYTGIARILMAVNLGIATSFWGDIPYSQAFRGQELREIGYDSQEEIYVAINELLNEAIEDLNQPAGDLSPGTDDLIYSGNAALWVGTARALKARYTLHLVKRDNQAAQKTLDALSKGTLFSNEVEPAFPFGPSQNEANPIAYFGTERPNQLAMNNFLLNLLDTTNDPRKEKYAVLESGNFLIYSRDEDSGLFWGRFDSPLPLISYSELLFIQAEANLRLGKEGLAQTRFLQAIRANMERVGIAEDEIVAFLTNQGDLSSLATTQAKLQKIMEQKYVALFGQGIIEVWTDFRRTGYPSLSVPADVSESFNPSKVVPLRYLYPISERQTNTSSVETAIARQNGHLLDNGLWAFE